MTEKDKIKAFKVVFTTIKAAYEIQDIFTKKKSKNKEIITICDNVLIELKGKKPNLDIVSGAILRIELILKQPESPKFAKGGVVKNQGQSPFVDTEEKIIYVSRFNQRIKEARIKRAQNIN